MVDFYTPNNLILLLSLTCDSSEVVRDVQLSTKLHTYSFTVTVSSLLTSSFVHLYQFEKRDIYTMKHNETINMTHYKNFIRTFSNFKKIYKIKI